MEKYKFIIDPGHAWLKVPLSEIKELGLEKKISGYSYINADFVYLEEDCDAGLFIDAKGLNTETQIEKVYIDGSWMGRNYYEHYQV